MLAEISIPDMWSLRSMLSVCGIIYFIICAAMFPLFGFWKGIVFNCGLLTVGFLFVAVANSDAEGQYEGAFTVRVFTDDGKSIIKKRLMRESAGRYGYYFDQDKDGDKECYNFEPEVYAMHDPQSDDYLCSPWFFHPASLVYVPGIFSLPVIIIGGYLTSKRG